MKIEFWKNKGSWRRPEEWVFSVDRPCPSGCAIVTLGWWGFSIYKKGCIRDDDKEAERVLG